MNEIDIASWKLWEIQGKVGCIDGFKQHFLLWEAASDLQTNVVFSTWNFICIHLFTLITWTCYNMYSTFAKLSCDMCKYWVWFSGSSLLTGVHLTYHCWLWNGQQIQIMESHQWPVDVFNIISLWRRILSICSAIFGGNWTNYQLVFYNSFDFVNSFAFSRFKTKTSLIVLALVL